MAPRHYNNPSSSKQKKKAGLNSSGEFRQEIILYSRCVSRNDIRWKLHLRAKHLASSHIKDEDIPPLPQYKSAVEVLADFMGYLFTCARDYIIESHASGASMWKSMENKIHFVLTHPNGWEGFQQQQIRLAAKIAGLIPEGDQHTSRIHLLAEGEASLHFCSNVLASDPIPNLHIVSIEDPEGEADEELEQQGVIIIDAGGGTIDLSAYSVSLSPPREFKEIAPAECNPFLDGFEPFLKHGLHRSPSRICFCHAKSACVSQRYIFPINLCTPASLHSTTAKLANSRYGSADLVHQMKDIFDKTTKLGFRNASDPQVIRFGTVRDKDPEHGIYSGQIKLTG